MDSLCLWLLEHYGKEQFTPGLERISQALLPIKDSFKNSKVITIAGTNGKGETALRLSQMLNKESHCLWASPHIERITERFQSEEGELPFPELAALIGECHERASCEGHRLTYYEFLFYVFCVWASRRAPRYLILEVGLGGRLDAVNFFDAGLVLLPSISRDHQEYLGNRYDLILREKLGVIRKDSILISALSLRYLRERAEERANQLGARMVDLESSLSMPQENFSRRNQFLASAAYLELTGKEVDLEETGPLEYRGEVMKCGAEWTFFGSHNVDGLRKLIQFLRPENYNLPRKSFDAVIMAFSERRQEDIRVMLRIMKASGFTNIKVTCFNHPKAASRETMEKALGPEGPEFVNDIDSFVQATNSGRILVTGSYYFLGHIKSLLRR